MFVARVEKSKSREYRFIDERIRFVRVEFWLHIRCIKIENVNLGEKSLYVNSCTRCQWYEYNLFLKFSYDTWLIPWFLAISCILGLSSVWWSTVSSITIVLSVFQNYDFAWWTWLRKRSITRWNVFSFGIFRVGKRSVNIFLALYLLVFTFPYAWTISVISVNEYHFIFFDKPILDSLHRVELFRFTSR